MLWKPRKPALWRVFSFQNPPSVSNKIPFPRGYVRGTAISRSGARTPMNIGVRAPDREIAVPLTYPRGKGILLDTDGGFWNEKTRQSAGFRGFQSIRWNAMEPNVVPAPGVEPGTY